MIFAAGETWWQSVSRPRDFFAAMPVAGYLSALAYYLPIGIIGAALELFWSTTLDAFGIGLDGWFQTQPAANPALERLMGFLLSPLTLLLALFAGSALVHGTLKVLGAARRPYVASVRVCAFASGTYLFLIAPWIGTLLAVLGSAILTVIGLREVHNTTTARAAAALIFPIVLLLVLATLFALLTVLAGAILPAL
ncbi:MAG: YIP1 family protein [Longimicrobiales bacterium]